MAKFKVGDRVRYIGSSVGNDVDNGQIGTVCEDSTCPWVVFDKPTRFTDSHDRHFWKTGYMDCPFENEMELVVGEVAECIAAYTVACEQFEAAELALEKAKQAIVDARLNLRDALDGET